MSATLNFNAGRFDHVHGDEHLVSAIVEREIEERAAALLLEKFADPIEFEELFNASEFTTIIPHLHRAILELDRACNGEAAAKDAVLSSLHQIQKFLRAEANMVWTSECDDQAEREILRERLEDGRE